MTEKTEGVYYAEGEAVPAAGNNFSKATKQAHLFCGCCCDTRRATIIVNIINIALSGIALLGMGVVASGSFADQFDDDTIKNDLAAAQQYMWIPILISCIGILISGLGMFGAMKYNQPFVMTAGIWYCVSAVLSLLGSDIGGAALAGLFAYPHFVFVGEMKKGIMTEENYPNEKHSCCCV